MYVTVIVLLFLDDIRITEGQTAVRLKKSQSKIQSADTRYYGFLANS